MGLKMESQIKDLMEKEGLFPSETPPTKIVVTSNVKQP